MLREFDFLILGAGKSGSSSLRASRTGHPEISVPPPQRDVVSNPAMCLQGPDRLPGPADAAANHAT